MGSEGKAVALADVGLAEVYEQVLTNIEIENAISGERGATARRIVVAIFDIMRARRRNGLPPYPSTITQGVAWILLRNH